VIPAPNNAAPAPAAPPAPLRIVIPIVAGIGNALMAVPMVRRIKRARPDSHITILARIGPMAEIFRRLSEADEVIVTGKGIKGLWRMIRSARQRRPDVYLVPFPSNRWQYAMLAAASGARQRVLHAYPVGYWRAMHFLPATRVEAVRGIHDVEQNLRLLRAVGIEPGAGETPAFALTDADRARADALLREAGLAADAKPIVLHAGSAQTVLAQAKRWPPERYAELARHLRAEFGDRIVLVEGPDEAGVAAEILRHASVAPPRVIRLAGPLGDAAALMERAELYVGSDSGLAHLAAAVGTPAVTIFAPADPDRVCPYGHRDRVVQAPTSCAPCFQYPWNSTHPKMRCHEPLCITQVTVEMVLAKARLPKTATIPQKGDNPTAGCTEKGDIPLFSKSIPGRDV
jgi:ADP-heptose:LPS heptosyltransferase